MRTASLVDCSAKVRRGRVEHSSRQWDFDPRVRFYGLRVSRQLARSPQSLTGKETVVRGASDCHLQEARCSDLGIYCRKLLHKCALGTFVVTIPTRTSGRSARYVALAITTTGRTCVSWAPTRRPTTMSAGLNPGPLIPQRRGPAATRP